MSALLSSSSSSALTVLLQAPSAHRTLLCNSSIGMKHQPAIVAWNSELCGKQVSDPCHKAGGHWSFICGPGVVPQRRSERIIRQSVPRLSASWITGSQIASNVFTFGNAAVIPFYALMVLAPRAELTKRSVVSSVPYIVLGSVYAYLLALSWTPETVGSMFASKYWLPELPGITRMFSNEMTVASAWVHLLAVDLYAARQVFLDGLESKVETRHSVALCLFFGPIGIMSHAITKILSKKLTKSH